MVYKLSENTFISNAKNFIVESLIDRSDNLVHTIDGHSYQVIRQETVKLSSIRKIIYLFLKIISFNTFNTLAKKLNKNLERKVNFIKTQPKSLKKTSPLEINDTLFEICKYLPAKELSKLLILSKFHRDTISKIIVSRLNSNPEASLSTYGYVSVNSQIHYIQTHAQEITSLNFGVTILDDRLVDAIYQCKNLKNLDFGGSFFNFDRLIPLENLEFLDLSGCVNVSASQIKTLSKFKKLKSLNLARNLRVDRDCLKEIVKLESLVQLNLSECSNITIDALEEVAKIKSLRSLNLNGLRCTTDDALIKISNNCDQIDEIELSECSRLTFNALEKLIIQHKKIRKINLSGLNFLKKLEIKFVLENLENLEELDLSNNMSLTDLCLKDINISKYTQLKKLKLGRCKIEDNGLKEIAMLKNLEELDLSENCISENGLRQLVGKLNKLQSLNCSSCMKIRDHEVKEIAKLKSLRKLNLDNIPFITFEGLKEIAKLNNLEDLTIVFSGGLSPNPSIALKELHKITSLKKLKFGGYNPLTEKGTREFLKHFQNLNSFYASGIGYLQDLKLEKFKRD